MTELSLYKFIHENSVEWRKQDNNGTPDIIIFPYVFQLEEFCNLVKNYRSDEGIKITLREHYVAIFVREICEYFNIDADKVFVGDGN
jgi:hypothetical protein